MDYLRRRFVVWFGFYFDFVYDESGLALPVLRLGGRGGNRHGLRLHHGDDGGLVSRQTGPRQRAECGGLRFRCRGLRAHCGGVDSLLRRVARVPLLGHRHFDHYLHRIPSFGGTEREEGARGDSRRRQASLGNASHGPLLGFVGDLWHRRH